MKRLKILLLLLVALLCSSITFASDSLKPIAPKGYILLTENGARKALRHSYERDILLQITAKQDTVIHLQSNYISGLELERNTLKDIIAETLRLEKTQRRKYRLRTFQVSVLGAFCLFILFHLQ